MTSIGELVASAERLCASLDAAANNEKAFCFDTCLELERMSWEMQRMSNNIKEIKECRGEK